MSPTSHCYFDYPYKRIDTRRAYSFEPVPAELDESHAERILGLQANFWSHIDREPEKVESQLFPRLLAIAERGWSPKDVRAFDDFQWRAKAHLVHLDDMDVHYRRPPAEPPIAPVGRWSPEEMSEKYKPLAWDVTAKIAGAGRYRVRFLYTRGSHRLGIEKCELLADGAPVSIDAHRGVTGNRHLDNEYVVTLEDYRSGTRYVLRASARSEGGTDSNGEVYLIKED